jgi:aarF domain-containing kinase
MQDTAKVNNRQAASAFQSDNTFNERNNYETDVTSEGINIAAIKAHNHNDDEQPQMQTTSPSTDNTTFSSWENQIENYDQDHENQPLPEGSAVPSGRIARAFGFASLGAGLAMGTVAELARRTLGNSNNNDPLVLSNDANAQRLSNSLRRMRGAAMKLGQMLSIQDESIAPPALTNALAQVRKGAEAMPTHQLMQQLNGQWGEGWKDKIELEERPFAAASIGQVHRGTLLSSSDGGPTKVAVKVQYPGVADSIESDLSNLSMLVKATGLAPPGLFLDNVIRVGREELKIECDYLREMENHKRFQQLIASDPVLVQERFAVPEVIENLCTDKILVTEYVRGGTIDKVVDLDQAERNRIGRAVLRLTMLELFVWRFMQTDPNWGNFLYDVRTRTTYLIDFGAAREYDEEFVRGYLNIVVANANRDEATLMKESIRMGFLTGDENDMMLEAHKLSGFCLGEPFQSYEPYDFKSSRITSRISEHGSVFLKHRLT